MREGRRAARSAALVVGFLAVAWCHVLVAVLVVLLVLRLLPGSVAVQVAVPLTIATGGLLWFATVRALRLRHRLPAGVPVTRQDAPALWRMIDAAATAAGVPAPAGVTLVAGATAALAERLRFGGLAGGRRDLLLGLPLLLAWDEARLRAVVAHELAHGSPRLGRSAPAANRGRVALSRIVPRIPRRSPAGPVLRAYARWYQAVDAPFARAQELSADQVAVSFAGLPAAIAVLRDGPALDGMQQLFHAEYLSPGWQAGYVPDDIFGGFLRMLAARADEMALLRAVEPEPPGAWDPHAALAERLAALTGPPGAASAAVAPADRVPDPGSPGSGIGPDPGDPASPGSLASPGVDTRSAAVPAAASSTSSTPPPASSPSSSAAASSAVSGEGAAPPSAGPATDLVPDLPGLGRALQAVAFPPGGRTTVGWDEFFGVARFAEMEREADASLRALSRAAGRPVTNVAEVLDLAAGGELRKIAGKVFTGLSAEETAERIADLITLLFALAALSSGAARWRHSWTGTAELVASDGSHLDLAGPAALAADPLTVATAREWLAGLGVDLDGLARGPASRPTARVPVLGGVVNVLVDGARTDLLVVETGLVLVPGLARSRHAEAKRRLTRLAAEGVLADGSPAGGQATGIPQQAASRGTPPAEAAMATGAAAGGGTSGGAASGGAASGGAASGGVARGGAASGGAASGGAASGGAARGGVAGSGVAGGGVAPASPATVSLDEGAPGAGADGRTSFGATALPGGPAPADGHPADGEAASFSAGRAPAAPGGAGGTRFVPFVDVKSAAARNGRRGWEIALHDGRTLSVRAALDSDELPGGWAALDEAVDFLTRTR